MELIRRTVKINMKTREATAIKEEPAEPQKIKIFFGPIIRAMQESCEELEEILNGYLNEGFSVALEKDQRRPLERYREPPEKIDATVRQERSKGKEVEENVGDKQAGTRLTRRKPQSSA